MHEPLYKLFKSAVHRFGAKNKGQTPECMFMSPQTAHDLICNFHEKGWQNDVQYHPRGSKIMGITLVRHDGMKDNEFSTRAP